MSTTLQSASIQSALFSAKSSSGTKPKSHADDFAAILQSAVNARQSQSVDTFESTTGATDGSSNEAGDAAANKAKSMAQAALNRAKKLDEDGNPLEGKVQTAQDQEDFKKVFHQFVGQTLYGQMLKSMRDTQQKPAYFHGGRAEEIFQGQLDQVLVDKMTTATSSSSLSDTMFKLMSTK